MRFTPATLALAVLFATVSSVGISQRPDSEISPKSLEWQAMGDAAQARGDLEVATDAYESALVLDPRNREAFIALGDVARAQGLQGKAVRYYRGALALAPNDMAAMGGTVKAMVERGAIANAKENLSKMKTLCRGECPQIAELGEIIERKATAQAALNTKDMATPPTAEELSQNP